MGHLLLSKLRFDQFSSFHRLYKYAHIHENSDCASVNTIGDVYYNKQILNVDPWTNTVYVADEANSTFATGIFI